MSAKKTPPTGRVPRAPRQYEIRIRGAIGPTLLEAFPELGARRAGPDTVLSGSLADPSALYGVIHQIEALALELLEVRSPSATSYAGDSHTRQMHRGLSVSGERRPRMILVTTAGKVGTETSRLLGKQGVPVRVIVRNAEKTAALAIDGVDVFKGVLEDPASIDAAMSDVSSVVLVTPPVVQQELNVIDSAVRAGVEHMVKITTKASADSPIARRRHHAEIERALIASGLGYTLLRNNAYTQNFLMMAPGIAKTNNFSTATGDGRVGHVDVRDVAAVAAEIAASPSSHARKTYWPTGPEALSGTEVAAVLSKVLGRTITFQPITFEEQKQAMLDIGLPETVADDNATAVAMMADGDCDYVTDDVASILGRPARSFEQFATDYAVAFSSAQAAA
jgi:uncharacterized protein YbjT (DUF2867 family)